MQLFNFIFFSSPVAMTVIACLGCVTAFFAASIALVQTDIKKVLAYSTVSQLGYMVLACGVGGFEAGMFHLTTHACFKALHSEEPEGWLMYVDDDHGHWVPNESLVFSADLSEALIFAKTLMPTEMQVDALRSVS